MYSLEVCTTRVGLSRYACRDSPPSTLDSLPGEGIDYVFASTVARRAVLTKYIPMIVPYDCTVLYLLCMYYMNALVPCGLYLMVGSSIRLIRAAVHVKEKTTHLISFTAICGTQKNDR